MLSKKVLGTVLTAAMVVTTFAPLAKADTGFTDVKDTDTFASAVKSLSALGVMQGDKGTFRPTDNFTRAEAAQVFVTATGYGKLKGSAKNVFTDVAATDWFNGVVNVANQVGVVSGWVKDGKKVFNPKGNVTYGELATMAVRSLGYKDEDLSGDTWPYNYMAKATELGLFDKLDSVDATAAATRGDVAVITNSLLGTPTKAEAAKDKPATLLNKVIGKLGLSTVEGVVYATSAEDVDVEAGKVQLTDKDGNTVKVGVGALNVADNLGKYIKAYTSKTGDIVSVNDVAASLVKTGKYSDLKDVVAQAGVVYYNGVKKDVTNSDTTKRFNLTKLADDTTVNAVDFNKDGKYDVAYLTKSEKDQFYVDSVDAAKKQIKTIDGKTITLIDKATIAGTATALADLKKYDSVTFTTDVVTDITSEVPKVETVKVARKAPVTGKVTGRDINNSWVMVDGKKYDVSNGDSVKSLAFDTAYNFYLDKDGKVNWTDSTGAVSSNPEADSITVVTDVYVTYAGKPAVVLTYGNGKTYKAEFSTVTEADSKFNSDYSKLKYAAVTLDNDNKPTVYTAAKTTGFNPVLLADDAVIYNKKTNQDGSITLEKLTAADFKTKYDVTSATSLVGYVESAKEKFGDLAKVKVVYYNGLVSKTTADTNYTVFINVGTSQISKDTYSMNVSVNGTVKALKLSQTAYDKVKGNVLTVSKTVYYDSADATKITDLTDAKVPEVVTSYSDAARMSVAGSVYAFADAAKVYSLNGNTLATKATSDLIANTKVQYVLNDKNQVEFIVALYQGKKVTLADGKTFNVYAPDSTGTDDIYMVGDLPGHSWDEKSGAFKLARQSDGSYTLNVKSTDIAGKGYKFVRGLDWKYVEKKPDGGEAANRTFTVNADGSIADVTIYKWADK